MKRIRAHLILPYRYAVHHVCWRFSGSLCSRLSNIEFRAGSWSGLPGVHEAACFENKCVCVSSQNFLLAFVLRCERCNCRLCRVVNQPAAVMSGSARFVSSKVVPARTWNKTDGKKDNTRKQERNDVIQWNKARIKKQEFASAVWNLSFPCEMKNAQSIEIVHWVILPKLSVAGWDLRLSMFYRVEMVSWC